MKKYRIENIQTAKINGKPVKLFRAFGLNCKRNAYTFIGQFSAPARTPNKNLERYIEEY
jgi:hypothetical protein